MTAQFRNLIFFDGETHSLSADPLESYLISKGITINSTCSACWSGYLSKWEILDTKLFLTDVNPCFTDDEGAKIVNMQNLFPGQNKVFASWFAGELLLQLGELLHYEHMGYSSVYEKHLFLIVKNGIVMDARMEDNRGKTFRKMQKITASKLFKGMFDDDD